MEWWDNLDNKEKIMIKILIVCIVVILLSISFHNWIIYLWGVNFNENRSIYESQICKDTAKKNNCKLEMVFDKGENILYCNYYQCLPIK